MTVSTTLLVCMVLNTTWPVSNLYGYVSGFFVSHFADHDHIRIGPQESPHGRGKGQRFGQLLPDEAPLV